MTTVIKTDTDVYINVNPEHIYIFTECYYDQACTQLIGRKYKDLGANNTMFFTGEYIINLQHDDPNVIIKKNSDLVWIKVSRTKFENRSKKSVLW